MQGLQESGNSLCFKHLKHKYTYAFNSNNRFILLKQIHGSIELYSTQFNTPPATISYLVCISLLLSICFLVLPTFEKGLHVYKLCSAHSDSLICPGISFPYRSFTFGSKELLSYLRREDYQKPLTDFRSFLEISKLALLAGERQEVSHTLLITQMQNS